MKPNTQLVIIMLSALVLIIASGVFFVLGLNQSAQVETDTAIDVLTSIGVDNQFRECAGSAATVCYSWQYISGSVSDGVLSVSDKQFPIGGSFSEDLQLVEVNRDLNVSYFVTVDSEQLGGYLRVTPQEFISENPSGCVEGAYFYFDQAPEQLNLQYLPVDDGHRGFLELYPCDDNPQQEQFFSYTRFTEQLLN